MRRPYDLGRSFIKRAAVRAAGCPAMQYAKAALQSEAGRKLLATTASKAIAASDVATGADCC